MMYQYFNLNLTRDDLIVRLSKEGRETKPCPFCKCTRIVPTVTYGILFSMMCWDCDTHGPTVADYNDPAGINKTSWEYALKVCHDKWNGRA